jgi:parallel beta-helix repeat protein
MYSNLWKKGMVLVIICLFMGAGVVPSISGNIEHKSSTEDTNDIENLVPGDQIDQQQTETEDTIYAKIPFGIELDDNIIVLAQSFKPTFPMLTKVDLLLRKKMSSNGITVSIKESLDGDESLASIQKGNSQISNYPSWTTFDFDDVDVIPDKTYYIVCTTDASALKMTYEWHFGYRNGEPIDNYDRGIAHTFQNNVWDSLEVTDFCFKTYGIPGENQYPTADFTWTPASPKATEQITFDASSSYDPDGNITTYEWDWNNDGTYDETHTTPTTTHTWTTPGDYPVTLKVTDNGELTNSITKTVFVYNLIVPDDYPTIQEAVDNSQRGYSIYVRAGGTYQENLLVDKEKITIHGGDKTNTTIDGTHQGDVIELTEQANLAYISGFTIKNSGSASAGINVGSLYNQIEDNNIVNNDNGIKAEKSSGNRINRNTIEHNTMGINIQSGSHANNITMNNIAHNTINGIHIDRISTGHLIKNNIINDNEGNGIQIDDTSRTSIFIYNTVSGNNIGVNCIGFSDGNRFHHNSFQENNINAYDSSMDRWDSEEIGNYWDDYTGIDEDGNGIGDTPYYIPGGDNVDRYPLMYTWGPPSRPMTPIGPVNGKTGQAYEYMTYSVDPNDDDIKYGWDWNGDKEVDEWTNYYPSGETVTVDHSFQAGEHEIYVISKDRHDQSSQWSNPLSITMPRHKNIRENIVKRLGYDIFNRILRSYDMFKSSIKKSMDRVDDGINQLINNKIYTGDIITVPDDYPTIQDAVDHANGGDTIKVRPGIYEEHVKVDKQLTITGENRDTTIIDGGGTAEHVIEITTDNVELNGFTIRDCDQDHSGIRIKSNHNRIYNNNMLNCGGGIELFWTNNNTVEENIINDCLWGVFICDSDDCIIQENEMKDNMVGMQTGLSLFQTGKTSIEFKDNTIINSSEKGIFLLRAKSMSILLNYISTTDDKGIVLFSVEENTINYNEITQSGNCSISIYDSKRNNFIDNEIMYSPPNLNPDTLDFESVNSDIGLCFIYRSNNNIIHHNYLENPCNIYDECCNTYDDGSAGNFWSDYNGQDADGDGIGDTPYIIPGGDNQDSYPLMVPYDIGGNI